MGQGEAQHGVTQPRFDIGARLLEGLHSQARVLALSDGDVLVAEGDEADEVFVVRSGRLKAWSNTPQGNVMIAVLAEGQVIGDVTAVAGGRRTATVRSEGDSVVLGVARLEFEQWLDHHLDVADALADQARARIDRSEVARMLSAVIGSTDTSIIQQIVERAQWLRLEAGEVLFRQGDHSDAAYFIVSGRMLVVIDAEGEGERMVRELGRGETVGELGLMDTAPRSATVRAIRDTTLATFPAALFEELAVQHPGLMLGVARGILTRLRRPPQRLVDRAGSVAVIVCAPHAPAQLVAEMLGEIARHGTVAHLSSQRVDQLLNRDQIAQVTSDHVGLPRLAEFMHESDVTNDHVLLQADYDMTPWTRRALRQADRAVIVVSPNPGPEESLRIEAVTEVLNTVGHVVRMLAVIQPADTERPQHTATLLTRLGATEIVHLHDGCLGDVHRLARLATGHGVGLVLGGGGARGFAHIGVYRALCELGVPIDHIGGCSIGAPIGGAIALGATPDDLTQLVKSQFHRLLDYTIPVVSLIKGGRISRNIEAHFETCDIEDLWLPYYCVSTNLTTSRLEVHRRGPVAKFIRASVAIPGVLPPVSYCGELLVDGGVLNNLPVAPMQNDGTIGKVIAVDVAPAQGPRAKADYGTSVSGWRALAASLRKSSTYPSMSAVVLRSMLAGAVSHQRESVTEGVVDLMINLHLPGIGLLEFDRVDSVARAGYERSHPLVAEWASGQKWLRSAR